MDRPDEMPDNDTTHKLPAELTLTMRRITEIREREHATICLGFVQPDANRPERLSTLRARLVTLPDAPTMHLIIEEEAFDGTMRGYLVDLWSAAVQVIDAVYDLSLGTVATKPVTAPPGWKPVERPGDGSRQFARN